MTDLLFDVSWWMPALLAFVGTCIFFNGNKLQVARLRNTGTAVLLAAVVWTMLSLFVDTPKKIVRRETRNLVHDAVDKEWGKFKAELAPAVVFRGAVSTTTGADVVTQCASTGCDVAGLQSAYLKSLTLEQTGGFITVRCDIVSTQTLTPIEDTGWQFDWEQTSSGWKIREMRLLNVHGEPASDIRDVPRGLR